MQGILVIDANLSTNGSFNETVAFLVARLWVSVKKTFSFREPLICRKNYKQSNIEMTWTTIT